MATITNADLGLGVQVELLADLGVGVVDTDLDGIIRGWNGAAALLYGRNAEAMVGTSVGAVALVDGDGATAASIAGALLEAGHWQGEVTVKDVAGTPLQLQPRAIAVGNDQQERAGFQAAFFDVSGRVQAEQRSAVRASRLRLVDRIAGLGVLTRVQGVTQNVTSRVQATERLREAEEFGFATLDSLTAHIAVLDEHGKVIAVNAS